MEGKKTIGKKESKKERTNWSVLLWLMIILLNVVGIVASVENFLFLLI